jgi:tetratricopeptide (TPR) repeat protein
MVIKEVLKFKPQVEDLRLRLINSYVALDYEMEKSLPVLYSERSRAYEGKGDIPMAIKDCLSMIEVSERHGGIRDPQQYIRIAALYQKSGQKEEQKTNIFQAIDLYEKQISSYDPTKNDPEADIIKKKTIAIYNDAISLLEKENSYGAKEKLKVFYLRRTELYGQFGDHQAVIDSAKEGIRSDSTDKSSCIELDAIRRKNHYLRGDYVKALLGVSPCKEKATAERSSASR